MSSFRESRLRWPETGCCCADAEQDTARRFLTARNLEQWVELWEKITDLTARADRVNLDRKQVVLSVFAALETTARG